MATAAASAGLTWAAQRWTQSATFPHPTLWDRTNHRGEQVSLTEGVALTLGLATASAVLPRQSRGPAVVAVVGAAAVGAVDDLEPVIGHRAALTSAPKGLAGHWRALRQGHVSTGAIKVVGLALTGMLSSAALSAGRPAPANPRGPLITGIEVLLGAGAIAACANVANLLDLRPGRALKAGMITHSIALLTGHSAPIAAAGLGSAATLLPQDLAGRTMLGDVGANPLGAIVGLAIVSRQGPRARAGTLAASSALILVSERVSFTEVIARTPVLRQIDEWGRAHHAPNELT